MNRVVELAEKLNFNFNQITGCRHFGPRMDMIHFIPPKGSEVFVGKLPPTCMEDEIYNLFSVVGKIYRIRLMVNFNCENRGYGYVQYFSKEEADKAITSLNGAYIRTYRPVYVAKSTDHRTLIISGLPIGVTSEEVRLVYESKAPGEVLEVDSLGTIRPAFLIDFLSHRTAALIKRNHSVSTLPNNWGKHVFLFWEPNKEVDERIKYKKEREQLKKLVSSLAFSNDDNVQSTSQAASTSADASALATGIETNQQLGQRIYEDVDSPSTLSTLCEIWGVCPSDLAEINDSIRLHRPVPAAIRPRPSVGLNDPTHAVPSYSNDYLCSSIKMEALPHYGGGNFSPIHRPRPSDGLNDPTHAVASCPNDYLRSSINLEARPHYVEGNVSPIHRPRSSEGMNDPTRPVPSYSNDYLCSSINLEARPHYGEGNVSYNNAIQEDKENTSDCKLPEVDGHAWPYAVFQASLKPQDNPTRGLILGKRDDNDYNSQY